MTWCWRETPDLNTNHDLKYAYSESREDWPVGMGRGGEDPRDASADYGKECVEASLELMIKIFRIAGV